MDKSKKLLQDSTHSPGLMGVYTTQIKNFSNNEAYFLQSVGNLTALVIEHKRIEEVLKESEDRFRMISASAQDAIIMLDNDERISYWNDAAEKIFDYSREEVIKEQIHKLIIPEKLREAHLNGFERFKETGQGHIIGKRVEVSAIRKDGREFPIELSLSAVKIKGKWNAIGMIRDITERIKSEKRLHAQHAVTHILSVSATFKEASVKILQAICESLDWGFGAIWLHHCQDDVLRCAELWHVPDIEVSEFKEKTNEIAFASGIGLPGRVWASGKATWITDVVHDSNFPRSSDALKAGLHAALGFPVVINEEVIGILEFFSQNTEEPDNDLLNMMSAIGRQIASFIKRKQIEEELRISHKMSSIGRLSANVFHEILNPVNIISAHTQLLLMKTAKGSKTAEDLKSIQDEIDRIVNITDNFFKVSKKEETEAGEVAINGLLEEALSLIKPELILKGIKLITKFKKDLPTVMAHGDDLRQVFLNLITNAVEAMPEGGMLIVKTRNVSPPALAGSTGLGVESKKENASERRRDFIEISFEDTGCGIESKDIDKIFEPFFSTRKDVVGVGLGLSKVHSLIEAYGGTIRVKSEKGKGTTFIIDLPC
ncbi:MAG: PAS domain S-box protein [Candidatus Scalindua rubra]|nr:PAS domain S-box protein [Candidatus Scalindua rubra]